MNGRIPSQYIDYVLGILRILFLLFPQFSLGRGLMDLMKNQMIIETMTSLGC